MINAKNQFSSVTPPLQSFRSQTNEAVIIDYSLNNGSNMISNRHKEVETCANSYNNQIINDNNNKQETNLNIYQYKFYKSKSFNRSQSNLEAKSEADFSMHKRNKLKQKDEESNDIVYNTKSKKKLKQPNELEEKKSSKSIEQLNDIDNENEMNNSRNNDEEDEDDKKKDTGDLICVVCGSSANGYNFDAITCESCKAFFRRNAFRQFGLFRCTNSDTCVINVATRKKCKKCRLMKCFKLGMRRDWIMTEVEREEKRKKIEENRRKKASNPNENFDSPGGSVEYFDADLNESLGKICTTAPIRRRRRRRKNSMPNEQSSKTGATKNKINKKEKSSSPSSNGQDTSLTISSNNSVTKRNDIQFQANFNDLNDTNQQQSTNYSFEQQQSFCKVGVPSSPLLHTSKPNSEHYGNMQQMHHHHHHHHHHQIHHQMELPFNLSHKPIRQQQIPVNMNKQELSPSIGTDLMTEASSLTQKYIPSYANFNNNNNNNNSNNSFSPSSLSNNSNSSRSGGSVYSHSTIPYKDNNSLRLMPPVNYADASFKTTQISHLNEQQWSQQQQHSLSNLNNNISNIDINAANASNYDSFRKKKQIINNIGSYSSYDNNNINSNNEPWPQSIKTTTGNIDEKKESPKSVLIKEETMDFELDEENRLTQTNSNSSFSKHPSSSLTGNLSNSQLNSFNYFNGNSTVESNFKQSPPISISTNNTLTDSSNSSRSSLSPLNLSNIYYSSENFIDSSSKMTDSEREQIDTINLAYKQAIQLVKAQGLPKNSKDINTTINLTELAVRRVIFYFKLNPDFRNLKHDLMVTLLKYNMMRLLQIHGVHSYKREDDTFKEPDTEDTPFSAKSLETVYGTEIYNLSIGITRNLNAACNGEMTHIKLLMLIVLFDPSNENLTLEEKEIISKYKNKYVKLLHAYLIEFFGFSKGDQAFQGIIHEMTKINNLARWFERAVTEKSDCDFVRPLMKEVLGINSTPTGSQASTPCSIHSNASLMSTNQHNNFNNNNNNLISSPKSNKSVSLKNSNHNNNDFDYNDSNYETPGTNSTNMSDVSFTSLNQTCD